MYPGLDSMSSAWLTSLTFDLCLPPVAYGEDQVKLALIIFLVRTGGGVEIRVGGLRGG